MASRSGSVDVRPSKAKEAMKRGPARLNVAYSGAISARALPRPGLVVRRRRAASASMVSNGAMAATAAAMSPPSRAVRVTASSTPATRRSLARPSSADAAILWSSRLRARRCARPTSEVNIEIAASVRVTSNSRRVATRITRRRGGRICPNAWAV